MQLIPPRAEPFTCGACVHIDPTEIELDRRVSYCRERMTFERWETVRGQPGDYFCQHWRA